MQPPPPSSIHLHPAHFNLHPALSTSTRFISFSTQLSARPSTIFESNIACNWEISPSLGQKNKSCPFWLKIDTYGILEVLILNPDLDFWNYDPKIHFWENLGPKIQSCPFCLKIGAQSISRMLIPNPDWDFWNFDPKIHFWGNLDPKTKSRPFCLKIGRYEISRMLILMNFQL